MEISKLDKKLHSANSYLSVIYGYLQLLESEISKRKDSKDIEWIRKALASCEKLKKLISEMEKEIKKN